MEELISRLSDMRGISGYEYRINEKIKEMFMPYCDEVRIDALGSVIAFKKGKTSKTSIMLEAHCDEKGLMVSDIDERGFLFFVNVGGVDQRILPSSEVVIHGTCDVNGVIGAKPPHLQGAGEEEKSVKICDMAIDTGLDKDEVKKTISIGDSIFRLQNDYFEGKKVKKSTHCGLSKEEMEVPIIVMECK